MLITLQAMIEAQLRQRLELQQAHQDYLELKAKKLAAQKEEEERFRQQVYIFELSIVAYFILNR